MADISHSQTQSKNDYKLLSSEGSLLALEHLIETTKERTNGKSELYAMAYSSTLKLFQNLYLQDAIKQEQNNFLPQTQYLPILGLNSYIYISAQVLGVEQAIQNSSTPSTKISVEAVKTFDPQTNTKTGTASNKQQVSLTYENIAKWSEPNSELMNTALITGGLKLPDIKDAPTHLWCLVACIAEPSRHVEWGIMTLIANKLASAKKISWAQRIQDHQWPPMVSSANFSMVKLKKKNKQGTDNFLMSWQHLLSQWLNFQVTDTESQIKINLEIEKVVGEYFDLLEQKVLLVEDLSSGMLKNPPIWKLK